MSFAPFPQAALSLATDRIPTADAERQTRSAMQILERLARQPGVVLADEVGMGKTFVALAVAASIVLDRLRQSTSGPVVVMVPSSLEQKWPKDWCVFREKCLAPDLSRKIRHASARTGVEFLRLLDDEPHERAHLIFLTHGALHRDLDDSLIKLALIRRAFKGRSSLRDQRDNFPKFAGRLLREESRIERYAPGLLGTLLETPTEDWLREIHGVGHVKLTQLIDDDPVPLHVRQALDSMTGEEMQPLVEELKQLPLRDSKHVDERIKSLRAATSSLLKSLWRETLKRADFQSPLVILDEAHHLKNPNTRLASLFVDEDAAAESEVFRSSGALGGKFERMLFLTATPFQLGHGELLNVLRRFEGIRWTGPRRPQLSRDEFHTELETLEAALNESQLAALRFEKLWSRVTVEHVVDSAGQRVDVDTWWSRLEAAPSSPLEEQIKLGLTRASEAMRIAEGKLAPWVIRNRKSASLSTRPDVDRRCEVTGAGILDDASRDDGLPIDGDALLPFLLAGRARSLLANSETGRAYFAEGLASSFEAYAETRTGRDERDSDEPDEVDLSKANENAEINWYLQHLDVALDTSGGYRRLSHPKVRATVAAAVRLWEAGEKLLIFSHYRASGRALRDHIAAALHDRMLDLGQQQLPEVPRDEIADRLDDIGNRFFDTDSSLRHEVDEALSRIISQHAALSAIEQQRVIAIARRFLRTPSFLVRYFDLARTDRSAVFAEAIERDDIGGHSLRQRLDEFCRFLSRLTVSDDGLTNEREPYLDALERLQPGTHFGHDIPETFDATELAGRAAPIRLPNVRLANGTISNRAARQRLLLAFNTPFFPEILVASNIFAEGVDLHLNCRHVVHHDLDWNPSVLEQRTGRIDRIGSKSEQVGKPIRVYLPYVAATQDEKMYRVVRDRDRWFQIVLGATYSPDELAESNSEKRSQRVPLPTSVQSMLALNLDDQ